jgi:hypothetical protein
VAARGRSEISGVGFIDRGYEDVAGRLARLGARVERSGDGRSRAPEAELFVTGTYGR